MKPNRPDSRKQFHGPLDEQRNKGRIDRSCNCSGHRSRVVVSRVLPSTHALRDNGGLPMTAIKTRPPTRVQAARGLAQSFRLSVSCSCNCHAAAHRASCSPMARQCHATTPVEELSPEDLWKLGVPIENVNAVALLVVEQGHLLLLVEIRADEGVAAFDVVAEVGQGVPERAGRWSGASARSRLPALEEQGELGHFHRLGVNVHAVDVVQEDAFALGDGEFPAVAGLHERGFAAFGPFSRVVGGVELQMPVEEELVGADEKGPGAASGVEDAEFFRLLRWFGLRRACPPSAGRCNPRYKWACNKRRPAFFTSGLSSTTARWPSVRRMTLPRNCS